MKEESDTTANEVTDEGSRVPLAPSQLVSHNGGQLVPTPPVAIADPTQQPSADAPQDTQPADGTPPEGEE